MPEFIISFLLKKAVIPLLTEIMDKEAAALDYEFLKEGREAKKDIADTLHRIVANLEEKL